jgi:hypothetical protein
MTPEVTLVAEPSFDFDVLLKMAGMAVGRTVASGADACGRPLNDAERWVACLSALDDSQATDWLSGPMLSHVSYSFAAAIEILDVPGLLAVGEGIAIASAESVRRGVQFVVLTGTLRQWRDAVRQGLQCAGNVRAFYAKVLSLFDRAGLGGVWRHFDRTVGNDGYVRLERK